MARLSKANLADRGKYRFTQEEVELPNIKGDDGKPGTVVVRSPSVKRRDEINRETPDEPSEWKIEHNAVIFAGTVGDPEMTKEEWTEVLPEWPAADMDVLLTKFNELVGADPKEMKQL